MSMALENFLIYTDATMGQAMALIGRNGRGIVLAVNAERQLLGTITDGDIRRAMLAGTKLETPVSALLATKAAANLEPVTAMMGTSSDALLSLMRHHSVRHVPLVDKELRVTGLVTTVFSSTRPNSTLWVSVATRKRVSTLLMSGPQRQAPRPVRSSAAVSRRSIALERPSAKRGCILTRRVRQVFRFRTNRTTSLPTTASPVPTSAQSR